jgi:phage/plasmid-like protein (TIGR03299 family)
MAHNIDMSNNRANMAFLGSRNDIWHRLGQQMQADMSTDDWAKAAGLGWEAIKVPAIAALSGRQFDHIPSDKRFQEVLERSFLVRSDTGAPLGYVSDRYQPVQPSEVLGWFDRYISVDDRFKLDVAGSLQGGAIIWATATFNGDLSIGGDKHKARLLMTTTFDGTGSTINKGVIERVVCNNTLDIALMEKGPVIKTRHNTRFDAARVGKELATLAKGFSQYAAVGDALAMHELTKVEVSNFFKTCLDIPFEAKEDEISTRKLNQFKAVNSAYKVSVAEGAKPQSAWAALQAITRYVDHDRTSGTDESKFSSSQFGSGAQMKGQAINLLLPLIKDKVPVEA